MNCEALLITSFLGFLRSISVIVSCAGDKNTSSCPPVETA